MLCPTGKKIIPIFLGAYFFLSACAPTTHTGSPSSEFRAQFNKLKQLYDNRNYSGCASGGLKALKPGCGKNIFFEDPALAADLVDLTSDCLLLSGQGDQASSLIADFLHRQNHSLSPEITARLRLKQGIILKKTGKYSEALLVFQTVWDDFHQQFPRRFAKYAKDHLQEIMAEKKADIMGKVQFKGEKNHSGINIEIFNGMETSSTSSLPDGSYSLPLFSSTPGTWFVITVYQQGYAPDIQIKKYNGEPRIIINDIKLETSANGSFARVCGLVYSPVQGGKRKPAHGISKVIPGADLTIQPQDGSKQIHVTSDENGIYGLELTPGEYKVKHRQRSTTGLLTLKAGQIMVNHVRTKRVFGD